MITEQAKVEESTKSVYQNPGYFGAFLNMAVLNVFAISNQIVKTFKELNGVELKNDSDIKCSDKNLLLQIFNNANLPSEIKWNVFNYLYKRQHFPVLKYFLSCYHDDGNQRFYNNETKLFERTHQFLQESFNALVALRNDFTHYIAIDDQGNEVEKKYEVHQNLANLMQDELLHASINFSKTRFEQTQIEEDFKFLQHVKLIEDNVPKLTEQGLYFFTSLFLERGKTYLFLKKLTGFKNETTPSFRATLKVFSAFCLKLPKAKIQNDDYKQSLLMEMLPELAKCPAILYNRLSEDDKQKFKTKISNEARKNIELNSTDYKNIDIQQLELEINDLVSQKRRSDRFHYFALRFLDELDVFKNIKFQIKLGRLMFSEDDIRDKEILGEIQARKITKTVCAFGKLSELEKMAENQLVSQLKGHTNEWKFDQFAPHYNMQHNKIAFCFSEQVKYPVLKKEDEKANQPDGYLSLHALPKLILTSILESDKLETLIKEFFKNNSDTILNVLTLKEIKDQLNFGSDPKELTRKLIDYNKNPRILSGKEKEEKRDLAERMEKEINDREDYAIKMKSRNKKLNVALQNYNLHHNQLPSIVKDYLLNIQNPSLALKINTYLKAEKLTFQQSLKKIKKQQELNHTIKLGELATIITRDMMNMLVDTALKSKLTPPYTNKIQNAIAHFGLKKNELINMLTEWKILDNRAGHVFLQKNHIKNSKGVVDFYENYVEQKIKYIDNIKAKTKNLFGLKPDANVSNQLPYKYRKLTEKYQKPAIKDYVKQKQKVPVNLPLNLFDEVLFSALRSKVNTSKTGLNNLLAAYLKDDSQTFYSFNRLYNINKEPTTVDVNSKSLKEIKIEFGKPVFENEKKIRYQQMIDRVMKMMCIELMQKQDTDLTLGVSQLELAKLSNATPDKNFLNAPVSFKRTVNADKELIAEDNEETKQKVAESIRAYKAGTKEVIEHWYSWTVKDYGRFTRLLVDRRLENLLKHFEGDAIPFSIIKYELDNYDKYWHKILDELLKVEKAIFEKDGERIKALQLGSKYEHVQFGKYVKWLKEKSINYDKKLFLNVRNKFSHSQFLEIDKVGLSKISEQITYNFNENYLTGDWINTNYESIASKVYTKFKTEIDEILKQIA